MAKITNYYDAVNFFGNSFILCNEISSVDPSIYDNANFDWYDEENDTEVEVFQWYLTDISQDDATYLADRFGLLFTYSDLLNMYILCVNHFGTSWKYVDVIDRKYA